MADKFDKATRSRIMAAIKGKNTSPEMKVRRLLWGMGNRYRIHDRTVHGTPDISIKKKKVAIFIDGCFWHGCGNCYREPKSNVNYWREKIVKNKKRRKAVLESLRKEQWTVMQFWEHEISPSPEIVAGKINSMLMSKDDAWRNVASQTVV